MAKKKKNPIYCYVCKGSPPLGLCVVCGYRVAIDDIDLHWQLRFEWLRDLWKKMRARVATSTGMYSLDLELVQRFGPWRTDLEITRDERYRITKIVVPIIEGERRVMQDKAATDKDIADLLERYK